MATVEQRPDEALVLRAVADAVGALPYLVKVRHANGGGGMRHPQPKELYEHAEKMLMSESALVFFDGDSPSTEVGWRDELGRYVDATRTTYYLKLTEDGLRRLAEMNGGDADAHIRSEG